MNDIDNGADSAEGRRLLTQLDLNLVTALDVLLAERSVTQAAKHLSVSQSAMSHTLGRLRDLLDDPVLIRVKGGMAPTPYAEALVEKVRPALSLLSRALHSPPIFDPATSTRTFRIAAPDIFCSLAAPAMWNRTSRQAPNVNLVFGPRTERTTAALAAGDVDVAVMARLDVPSNEQRSDLMRRTLLRDSFVSFVRREHPLCALLNKRRSKKSLRAFAQAAHVLVSPDGHGKGVVDEALQGQGLERRIALRVPNFQSALIAAARTNLIVTAPAMLAAHDVDKTLRPTPLVTIRPPLDLPRHFVDLVWHKRVGADPGHRWLRECLIDTSPNTRR